MMTRVGTMANSCYDRSVYAASFRRVSYLRLPSESPPGPGCVDNSVGTNREGFSLPRGNKRPITPVSELFWRHVQKADGCWPWTARTREGYGRYTTLGRTWQAHRLAYELTVGPIPDGLTIDHLCLNTLCVNPAHLEPVPLIVNMKRHTDAMTHCKHGHELAGDNLRVDKRGFRNCRACQRIYRNASAARRRAF